MELKVTTTLSPSDAPLMVPLMIKPLALSLILIIKSVPAISLIVLTIAVGASVSMANDTELLVSAPSILLLPTASLNLLFATDMAPATVLFAVGVKVAV